jgi:hypothetical protein
MSALFLIVSEFPLDEYNPEYELRLNPFTSIVDCSNAELLTLGKTSLLFVPIEKEVLDGFPVEIKKKIKLMAENS